MKKDPRFNDMTYPVLLSPEEFEAGREAFEASRRILDNDPASSQEDVELAEEAKMICWDVVCDHPSGQCAGPTWKHLSWLNYLFPDDPVDPELET